MEIGASADDRIGGFRTQRMGSRSFPFRDTEDLAPCPRRVEARLRARSASPNSGVSKATSNVHSILAH